MSSIRVHPTAIIEEGVVLGDGTSVWDNAHLRHGTRLGEACIVGGKSYIAYDVCIGNRVKINSFVYICHGVTIDDGVMLGAGTVFTNDRLPRATTPDLAQLRPSEPDEHTLQTRICEGATLGARCTIGPAVVIGRFAMVGMASVVTRDIPDFHLAVGSPARSVGCVCRCGEVLLRFAEPSGEELPVKCVCSRCEREYEVDATRRVREVSAMHRLPAQGALADSKEGIAP